MEHEQLFRGMVFIAYRIEINKLRRYVLTDFFLNLLPGEDPIIIKQTYLAKKGSTHRKFVFLGGIFSQNFLKGTQKSA